MTALWLPVDIVSKKQVVGTWWISTFVKMSHQVLILAMNVATYVNWSTKLYKHRLWQKYVTWEHAQLTNVRLWQLHLQHQTSSACCVLKQYQLVLGEIIVIIINSVKSARTVASLQHHNHHMPCASIFNRHRSGVQSSQSCSRLTIRQLAVGDQWSCLLDI